jgi:hypothetical protein
MGNDATETWGHLRKGLAGALSRNRRDGYHRKAGQKDASGLFVSSQPSRLINLAIKDITSLRRVLLASA